MSQFKLKLVRSGSTDGLPVITEKDMIGDPKFGRSTLAFTNNDIKIQYSRRIGVPYGVLDVSVGLWINHVVMNSGAVWTFSKYTSDFQGCCDDYECDNSPTPILVEQNDFYWRDEDEFAQEFYYPYSMNGLAPNRVQRIVCDDNYFQCYFLDAEGVLWMLGDCDYGICGAGEDVDNWWECLFPAGVESYKERLYVDIAVFGQGGGIAICTEGKLWTWGYEAYGYIGNGKGMTHGSYAQQRVPFNPMQGGIAGGDDISGKTWVSAGASWYVAAAVCSEGKLWTWGQNSWGDLGQGLGSTWTIRPYPVQIGSDTDWLSVNGTEYALCAQKTDGSLHAWGDTFNGNRQTDVPTSLSVVADIGMYKFRYYWIMANINGKTKVWGYQLRDLQLGLPGVPWKTYFDSPQDFPVDFVKFDIESWHGMGLDANGVVWIWGEDYEDHPTPILKDWDDYTEE